MKKTIKKATAKKMAMKKMFAVVQNVFDREDLEDSEVTICGVYDTRNIANQKCILELRHGAMNMKMKV